MWWNKEKIYFITYLLMEIDNGKIEIKSNDIKILTTTLTTKNKFDADEIEGLVAESRNVNPHFICLLNISRIS